LSYRNRKLDTDTVRGRRTVIRIHNTRYDAVFWDVSGVVLDFDSARTGHCASVVALADRYDLDVEAATPGAPVTTNSGAASYGRVSPQTGHVTVPAS
jgi:hypothetical protein